jgi:hypothetical protein
MLIKSFIGYFCRGYCFLHTCRVSGVSVILSPVSVFGLVIGFINNLQVVTTINYYTIAALHNIQSLHTNLLSLSALVFTGL